MDVETDELTVVFFFSGINCLLEINPYNFIAEKIHLRDQN